MVYGAVWVGSLLWFRFVVWVVIVVVRRFGDLSAFLCCLECVGFVNSVVVDFWLRFVVLVGWMWWLFLCFCCFALIISLGLWSVVLLCL